MDTVLEDLKPTAQKDKKLFLEEVDMFLTMLSTPKARCRLFYQEKPTILHCDCTNAYVKLHS